MCGLYDVINFSQRECRIARSHKIKSCCWQATIVKTLATVLIKQSACTGTQRKAFHISSKLTAETRQYTIPDGQSLAEIDLDPQRNKVIQAIKSQKYQVTASSISASTGLALNRCSQLLNNIASETRAQLQVTQAGSLIYSFDQSFEQVYAAKGLAKAISIFCSVVFRMGFYLLRISFGVILVASIIIVITLIVAVIIAALCGAGDSGGGGDGGGGGGSFDFFDLGSLGDGFRWDYSISHRKKIQRYGVPESNSFRVKKNVEKGNFFLECFSFLFGDGEPNPEFEEKSWELIAEVIKHNQGIVAVEQLLPYTPEKPSIDDFTFQVLARYNGRPEVSETGNILLVFDEFRNLKRAGDGNEHLAPFLQEHYWCFSTFPATSIIFVLFFASLNFAGSYWLYKHIASIALLSHFATLIDCLLAYAVIFLTLPFLRIIFNALMNISIRKRNAERRKMSSLMHSASDELAIKLQEAKSMSAALPDYSRNAEVIYTTEKDQLEQQIEHLEQ